MNQKDKKWIYEHSGSLTVYGILTDHERRALSLYNFDLGNYLGMISQLIAQKEGWG